ncbi:hypothetical protein HPB52_002190 [Rhipicephalus sanguineus]|uniref:Uncharacterized protein n=1 Tax=Rhipicephalus sanguineus TaxID=34632 RepID=A0A9D4SPJ5_RHISA|nr:hypothetical protein HPB52_002190 [Rhipicephalus sanguineus]
MGFNPYSDTPFRDPALCAEDGSSDPPPPDSPDFHYDDNDHRLDGCITTHEEFRSVCLSSAVQGALYWELEENGVRVEGEVHRCSTEQETPKPHALRWKRSFPEVTAAGVHIDGKVLREKADETALALRTDGFQTSADYFCTADDNLATCGARTVEDIVEEATCEVADFSDDGDDIGEGEGPPLAAEMPHALDVLRHPMAADEISDDTCPRFQI